MNDESVLRIVHGLMLRAETERQAAKACHQRSTGKSLHDKAADVYASIADLLLHETRPVWTTREDGSIPVSRMTDAHLIDVWNAVAIDGFNPHAEHYCSAFEGVCAGCAEMRAWREHWISVFQQELKRRGAQ